MTRRLITQLLFFCCMAFAVAACGPSAKNEQQYWDNNNRDIAELSIRWAGYKGLMAAHQASAKPLWDEASALTDEKAKAEKMKAANAALKEGLVARGIEVKYKVEALESAIKKLNDLKLEKSQQSRREAAVSSARSAIAAVESTLAAAVPASDEEGKKLLDEQVSKLISAQGNLDRAHTSLKPSKGKKK